MITKYCPEAIVEGNNSLPRTGSFEITINNVLKYSKFQTNEFPDETVICNWFKK